MPPLSLSINKHTAHFLKNSRISSSKYIYGVVLRGVHYQTELNVDRYLQNKTLSVTPHVLRLQTLIQQAAKKLQSN